jgi:hypothetical protein
VESGAWKGELAMMTVSSPFLLVKLVKSSFAWFEEA